MAACVLGSVLFSRRASADPACGQRPWIAVDFREASWPAQFRETVLADLRASLSERRIDVCLPDQATIRTPLARITLTAPSDVSVSIVVVAADEKAQKRAERVVSLVTVPSDGRPFAVALATDELLKASWSELALLPPEVETHEAAAPPPPPPPPPPLPVVEPPKLSSLAGAALIDWFVGNQGYGGGELRFRHVLSDNLRWSVEGAAGGALGKRIETAHGTVKSSSLLGAAWLRYVAQFVGTTQFGVAAGTRLGYHRFTGAPLALDTQDTSVSARTVAGVVGSLMGRFDVRLALGASTFCDLGVEVGVPVRSLQITDSGAIVTGATGFRFTPSAGAGLQW